MAYSFEPATPPGHFVTEWISYASRCTDAPHEYHEAAALWMLACVTPRLRARFSAWPAGLPTNLYLLLIGPTGFRKSTAIGLAEDMLRAVAPDTVLPEKVTPEAFIEQLSHRSNMGAGWAVDEFTSILNDIHHKAYMASLRELLLTVYGGKSYEYRRHSKRVKGGGTVQDVDRIENPHLSILGGATPAIFEMLSTADLTTGFMPRFGIVMPDSKPERKSFYGLKWDPSVERNRLRQWLHALAVWASKERTVDFEERALEILDSYAAELEELNAKQAEDPRSDMRQRLSEMSVKIAMLVAAGDVEPHKATDLLVTDADAQAAVQIVRRWQRHGEQLAERIQETQFEAKLQQAYRILKVKKRLSLRDLSRAVRVPKRVLDEILDTMLTRGLIAMQPPVDGRASPWILLAGEEEVVSDGKASNN